MLRVIAKAVKHRISYVNANQVPVSNTHFISFVKEDFASRTHSSKPRANILSSADDWQMVTDLDGEGCFPQEIAITLLRPDIVIWSRSTKEVIIGELTVPWEDNLEYAHERKFTKYAELRAECGERGWKAKCYPFEVDCRGFVAFSFQKWLLDLGLSRRDIKSVCREVSEAAESGSSWVWSKYIQMSR